MGEGCSNKAYEWVGGGGGKLGWMSKESLRVQGCAIVGGCEAKLDRAYKLKEGKDG